VLIIPSSWGTQLGGYPARVSLLDPAPPSSTSGKQPSRPRFGMARCPTPSIASAPSLARACVDSSAAPLPWIALGRWRCYLTGSNSATLYTRRPIATWVGLAVEVKVRRQIQVGGGSGDFAVGRRQAGSMAMGKIGTGTGGEKVR
jgi:hypothetical protein